MANITKRNYGSEALVPDQMNGGSNLPMTFNPDMDADLAKVQACVYGLTTLATSVRDIWVSCNNTKVAVKELEVHLEAYIQDSKERIEKYKAIIPVLHDALKRIFDDLSVVRNRAYSFIPTTEAEWRMYADFREDLKDATARIDKLLLSTVAQ